MCTKSKKQDYLGSPDAGLPPGFDPNHIHPRFPYTETQGIYPHPAFCYYPEIANPVNPSQTISWKIIHNSCNFSLPKDLGNSKISLDFQKSLNIIFLLLTSKEKFLKDMGSGFWVNKFLREISPPSILIYWLLSL
jgi:hypothetical protein